MAQGKWKHVYAPRKGIVTSQPSTLLPPEASPYIKGCLIKDGVVESDYGHTDFPVPADGKCNHLSGTVMRIDQFYKTDGTSFLLCFTTTDVYKYNTSSENWDNITQGAVVENCEDAWTAFPPIETKLLLHCDGTDGSTTFTDNGNTGHTITNATVNNTIDDEDMADITDWEDKDFVNGVSSQVTFDSKSCMKLDSGAQSANTGAWREQDIGTFGTVTAFTMSVYFDAIGTLANSDYFLFGAYNGTTGLACKFCSDGLFVYDGAGNNEVGTNIVVQDTWQKYAFVVNWTAQTVDVWLDDVLIAADVDCSNASETVNGTVLFIQYGNTTANRISYVDYFKAGTGRGVYVNTTQKEFGTGSARFDGGSYLSVPDHADWNFGTGDFTIDFWARFNALPGDGAYQGFYGQYISTDFFHLYLINSGGVYTLKVSAMTASAYAARYNYTWTPSVDTWYHIAFVRNGSNFYLFIGGDSKTWTTVDTAISTNSLPDSTAVLTIGATTDSAGLHYFNGWMDEVRVSKGIARWTANFTPPVSAYPLDPTTTTDSTIKMLGTNSSKIVLSSAIGAGRVAYENFSSVNLSGYTELHFYIRSSVVTSAGDLQIRVSEENTGGTGASYEDLDVPALVADEWRACGVAFTGAAATRNAVLSVSLVVATDLGAQIVYIDDVKAVKKFTGDEDNFFSTCNMNNTFIATNGVDQPQEWPGTGNFGDLTTTLATGSITTSEVVISFKDHLVFFSNTENAADCPQRASWTNIGTTEDFVAGTAGYQDLVDDESWVVAAEQIGENEYAVYKERSIVKMTWVGGHTPFRFNTMVKGTGALSKEGVVDVGGEHMVIGPDVIYAYKGEKEIEVLDDVVKKELYDGLDGTNSGRVFLMFVEEDDELQVWVPTEASTPDLVWCYNVVEEIWYRKVRNMTGYGFYQMQAGLTIGDLVGTIGEQNWRFGDALVKAYSPITLVGDTNGKVYKLDKTTLNNDGSAITNEFQTPDFTLPDTPEYLNMFMRVAQLSFEVSGNSVTTEWSSDEGSTWHPTQGGGTNTTTLDSIFKYYQQDFDATERMIRFRFRNTTASSGFKLRYYGFYWIPRSGRR